MKVADLFSVSGKTALVTGGSRGIGLMMARGLVQNGAKVYISSRKATACEAAVEELSQFGEAAAIPADLSSSADVVRLAREFSDRETKLDILVNNAGAVWGEPFDSFSEDGWDKVVDLDMKAPFFLTQQLVEPLARAATAADPARVIHVASIDGLRVSPMETYSYAAAKAGLIHLTRMMARNLAARNITVNSVAPGPFETKMMAGTLAAMGDEIRRAVPLQRLGSDEDMAGVCLYLASRAGAYVTGTTIPVCGGSGTTGAR